MGGTAILLMGPTATGKTEASLAVAEAHGATIVSADAMQVYRGMDIGTAKATPDERARAPHVGVDVVDPDEPFDVRDFLDLADGATYLGANEVNAVMVQVQAGADPGAVRQALRDAVRREGGTLLPLDQVTRIRDELEAIGYACPVDPKEAPGAGSAP